MTTACDEIPAVDLTAEEADLYGKIRVDSSGSHDSLQASCVAAGKLARSLLARKAVPSVRLRYFIDPDLNTGSRKSRQNVFESNGTRGDAILSHGNFLPYLRYFIAGPDLPDLVVNTFRAQVRSMGYVSGSDVETLKQIARTATRQSRLSSRHAAEEFFKLAIECGIEVYMARMIRDAVGAVR